MGVSYEYFPDIFPFVLTELVLQNEGLEKQIKLFILSYFKIKALDVVQCKEKCTFMEQRCRY